MSNEGPRLGGSHIERSEIAKQPIDVQIAQIEDDYRYFTHGGSYGVDGYIWNHLPDLPTKGHVVDLNSEGGDLARFSSDFSSAGKIYIVDHDPQATKRKGGGDILERPEVVVSQQEPVTFEPTDPVDIVMANNLLRKIPEAQKEERIRHIYSYLNAGGKLLWSDMVRLENETDTTEGYERRRKSMLSSGYSSEAVEKFFEKERTESHPISIEDMRVIMERVGFKDIEVEWQEGTFAMLVGVK